MMKRKNVLIIAGVIIIAVLAIFVFVRNTASDKKNLDSLATPEASVTPPQVQSPSTSATPSGNPSATPSVTPAVTEKYKSESVKDFNVTFKIPEDWKKMSGYDNRYEGKSGFAEFTALSGYGLTLKEAVDLQINNESKTFGDKPEVKGLTIDSQEASIIYSTDKASNAQCAILVKFPKPVTISATPYNYLLVWADRDHADNLAKEIKFSR